MSSGGGDHGRNAYEESVRRHYINARLSQQYWKRERARMIAESAKPLPKEAAAKPSLLTRILRRLGLR